MGHLWQKYVLGGVEHPQIYFVGANLVSNPGFETNTTGWTFSNLTGTQISTGETFYGDYCLKLDTLIAANAKASCTYPAASKKTYLFTFFAKNNRALRERILFLISSSTTANSYYYFNVGPDWEQFSVIHEVPYTTESGDRNFYVYPDPATDYDASVSMSFDNFQCYEVSEYYELGEPQIHSQSFEKVKYTTNEMIDGSLREYIKGWRYKAKLFYEFETALQEKIRTKISNGTSMIFFPHKDSFFCQSVIWDKESFTRSYFKEKYLGYTAEISLKGANLISKQPTDIVGVGGYAMDDLSLPVIS